MANVPPKSPQKTPFSARFDSQRWATFASAAVLLVPGGLVIGGFDELPETPSWTRSSVQPPLLASPTGRVVIDPQVAQSPAAWLQSGVQDSRLPIRGRAVNQTVDTDTVASWIRSSATPSPATPGQYFGRTVNDPDPFAATPGWLRSSLLPPLVPTNITVGGFDTIDSISWLRGLAQTPVTPAAGQLFGRAVNYSDIPVTTPSWLRISIQPPAAPPAGQFFGRAISEPYQTVATQSWVRSIVIPTVSVGTISLTSAQHSVATPAAWLRSPLVTTPAVVVPPAGTIIIGASWPHEASFAWFRPTPTATPIAPVPPAGTILIGAAWPHAVPFSWTTSTPTMTPPPAPPNIHKLYYDISSGRLFWQVSVTANPILIEPV